MPDGADAGLLQIAASLIAADPDDVIGIAVSGGSDSMAVLHLMAAAGGRVHAVTVDHRLRSGSPAEAAFVAEACARLGVPHQVLIWDHGAVAGNLPDQARRARYALMARWASEQGIGRIVLGHTANDQAETVLMGLARAAGLDGLTGMRVAWAIGGVTFLRPFLQIPRAELRASLMAQGLAWVEDPTNADGAYQRVRARRALSALGPLGITVEGLCQVAGNLERARAALEQITVEAAQAVATEQAGSLCLNRDGFGTLIPEVQRRLLISGLKWVSSAGYAPRAAAVDRCLALLLAGKDATLWGCRLRVTGALTRIIREARAVADTVESSNAIWDGRWQMKGPHVAGLVVRALGNDGLQACRDWRKTGLPRDILITSPAIWHGDTLIAAPLAGKSEGWTATVVAGFGLFAVSH